MSLKFECNWKYFCTENLPMSTTSFCDQIWIFPNPFPYWYQPWRSPFPFCTSRVGKYFPVLSLLVLPQHHPPAWLTVSGQDRFEGISTSWWSSRGSFREILLFPVFVLLCWMLLLLIFLFRRAAFIECMFTMVSATVKNLPLKEQLSPDVVGCCHEARNILFFNVLIQKEDIAPQATTDLVIESVGLSNHFLHDTKPSEVQSKLSIRDEWAWLYCYTELLSSTLCS